MGKTAQTWLLAILLAATCVVAYDPTRMENTSGDTISARYWPVAVLKHHTLKLNFLREDLHDVAYTAIYYPNGDWISRADIGMMLFELPFYAAASGLGLVSSEWTHDEVNHVARANAIFLATIAVLLLFFLCRRFVSEGVAFASALAFALTTYHWSLGAQGVVTQNPAVLLHILSFYPIWRLADARSTARERERSALALGLIVGVAWSCRPSTLFMAVAPLLLIRSWRALLAYALGAAATLGPTMAFYLGYYHHILGWRGILATMTSGTNVSDWLFQGGLLAGAPGILFSPNRGAIVFLPCLLLTPYLWIKLMPRVNLLRGILKELAGFRIPRWPENEQKNGISAGFGGTLALGALAYFAATTSLGEWHGSWAYGPRYLYDIQPYIWIAVTLGINEVWRGLRKLPTTLPAWARAALVACLLIGGFVHGLGHRNFDIYVWNLQGPVGERVWNASDFILADTWNAGTSRGRWPNALSRLQKWGY